ncbi:hypothetical protein GCM10009633_09720 [Janibacter melonis]|uniref:hypothetical protein n=1 Tax=Janibacter melonis TaxID=262209 RepID=UPI001E610C6B|nr:hypothetical protein [Janibacter melonis]MCB5992172.1 hypothetical protein [Janibacter melonis]
MTERATTRPETSANDYGVLEAEMLAAWFDVDTDDVETAVIPRLALGHHVVVPVELPAGATTAPVSQAPTAAPAPAPAVPAPAAAPAPSLVASPATRHRHASAESLDAVRRNQVALAVVVTAIVLLGAVVGLIGGWIALAGYALLVGGLLLAQHLVNRRYTARHTRHVPRHG